MRAFSLLAVAALLLLAAPAAAQSFQPSLELRVKEFPQQPLVPGGEPGTIVVQWRYLFRETTTTVFTAAQESTTLHWDPAPACEMDGFVLTGPATSTIQFAGPGAAMTQNAYEGQATFLIAAAAGAVQETIVKCTFNGRADGIEPSVEPATAAPVTTQVAAVSPTPANVTGDGSSDDARTSPVGGPLVLAVILAAAAVAALGRRRA